MKLRVIGRLGAVKTGECAVSLLSGGYSVPEWIFPILSICFRPKRAQTGSEKCFCCTSNECVLFEFKKKSEADNLERQLDQGF